MMTLAAWFVLSLFSCQEIEISSMLKKKKKKKIAGIQSFSSIYIVHVQFIQTR